MKRNSINLRVIARKLKSTYVIARNAVTWQSPAIFLILILSLISTSAFAGKLDKFEKNLEKKDSKSSSSSSSTYYESSDYSYASSSASSAEIITRTWWEMLAVFMLAGTQGLGLPEGSSMAETHKALKAIDSPLLPTIKLEGNYQYVVNNIHGYDATLTLGYMMFAADVNVWHLFERNPDDQLKFISPHFLLRFAPFGFMQIDLAVGAKVIMGNRTYSGFEGGFPAYFFFTKNFIWDIKTYISYINDNILVDVSSGLNYRIKYFGVRAGYRMIELRGDYTHGPQAGLFFQW